MRYEKEADRIVPALDAEMLEVAPTEVVSRDETLDQDKWEVGMKWEPTQILSRDGTVLFKTDVFFGSFDQFLDRVQGLGACSILALTIAQHMICNPTDPLSREEFDNLIYQRS